MGNLAYLVFPILLAVAAVYDLKSFTIPNRVVGALLFSWPLAVIGQGVPLSEVILAAGLATGVLLFLFGLFAANLLGAGDAKLVPVAVLWIGPAAFVPFMLGTCIAGGLFAILLVLFRKAALPGPFIRTEWIFELYSRQKEMPYGVAIAVAGIAVWPQSLLYPY